MKVSSIKSTIMLFLLCCAVIVAGGLLVGCGQDGATGPAGPAGAPGTPGTDGQDTSKSVLETCLICHGPGTIAAIKDVHAISTQSPVTAPLYVSGGVVDINQQGAAQLAGLKMAGTIDLVTIATVTPVVNFTITDGKGHGIVGLKANVSGTSLSNVRVTINQLVESSTNAFPSYWQSYEVTSSSRPTDEGLAANFVDNGNGTYTYTMNKNVTTVPGVTFDPNNTHRLAIRVYGAVAGGTLDDEPLDLTRDFVPSAAVFPGTPIQHDIVAEGACDSCHYQLGITTPHGGRDDPKYCVVCHTYQRGIGRAVSLPSSTGLLTGSTNILGGQIDLASDPTSSAAGYASGEFVRMIHKLHKSEGLALQNYVYGGIVFNEITYPQDVRNCTKCHAGTQGGRHLTNPSRKACGACHDNVTWAATVLPGFVAHSNGAYPDDTQCALCHTPTNIANFHVAIAPPDPENIYLDPVNGNNNTNAACLIAAGDAPSTGAITINYVISSVSTTNVVSGVTGTINRPTMKFKLVSGTTTTADVVFNTYSAATSTGELVNGFVGAPSVYFAWSVPQDGITAPADFNASASGYIRNINNKTATGSGAGTISGPDGSGFYTITLTGVQIPASAKMLTGGVGYSYGLTNTQPFTQTSGYTIASPILATYCTYSAGNKVGGLIVPAQDKWMVATGYTGRRIAVANDKCNACHGFLGVNPTFHAGQRNDAPTCSICHHTNRTNSGWAVNVKDIVHAIHAAAKRTAPFTWEQSAGAEFWKITYPLSGDGSDLLKYCGACHVDGYNDFSNAVYTPTLMNNMLFTTAASGTLTATSNPYISPYVSYGVGYGNTFSFSATTGATTTASGNNLVISPISSACFACHDTTNAKEHMKINGGSIYEKRSIAIP
jgi:OmcA/MtrC family decaheme c-type cytochrome